MLGSKKIVFTINFVIISVLTFFVALMLNAFVVRVFIEPPIDATIDASIERNTQTEVIQVNVLNGCGEAGLAAKAKDYMRARGYDVVEIGNYSEKISNSLIIDRLGDKNSARKVAYALGIKDSLIISQIDSNLFLRTTVIIGEDFYNLKPFNKL